MSQVSLCVLRTAYRFLTPVAYYVRRTIPRSISPGHLHIQRGVLPCRAPFRRGRDQRMPDDSIDAGIVVA